MSASNSLFGQEYAPGQFLVRINESAGPIEITYYQGIALTGIPSIDSFNFLFGVVEIEKVVKVPVTPEPRIYLFILSDTTISIPEICNVYTQNFYIDFAEPDYIAVYTDFSIPNDPYFNEQWHLHNHGQVGGIEDSDIDAPQAWSVEIGNPNVIIAMFDSGFDWDHEDLIDKVWQNLGEDIDGDGTVLWWNEHLQQWEFDPDDINGEDDDYNGYIDDFIGWDFEVDTNDVGGQCIIHGTKTSGVVAATTNNGIGVAGVAQLPKIQMLQIGCSGNVSQLVEAIYYAGHNFAKIGNMSLRYFFGSSSLKKAVQWAYQEAYMLLIASTGNDGEECFCYWPASYPEVMGIGATDTMDLRANFSNGGSVDEDPNSIPSIELVAPGTNIFTTLPNNQYDSLNDGTSFSAPIVAGIAALMYSKYQEWTNYPDSVRKWLILTADKVHPDTVTEQHYGYDYYLDTHCTSQSALEAHPGWNHLMGYGRVNAYDALMLDPNPILNASFEENDSVSDFYRFDEETNSPRLRIRVEKCEHEPCNVHTGNFSVFMEGMGDGYQRVSQRVATKPDTKFLVDVYMKPVDLTGETEKDGAIIWVNDLPITKPIVGTERDFILVQGTFTTSPTTSFVTLSVGLTKGAWGTLYIDDLRVSEVETYASGGSQALSSDEFILNSRVYPNPFRDEVFIELELQKDSKVKVAIYNSIGQRIKILEDGKHRTGRIQLVWDGRDGSGRLLPSGVYFYRIETPVNSLTKRVLLLR